MLWICRRLRGNRFIFLKKSQQIKKIKRLASSKRLKNMGNKTNEQNWAAMERLRFIERCAWWKGVVNRKDLVELFGVSLAQASSDIQKYIEMNPTSLMYNLKQKCYFGTVEMKCVLQESAATVVEDAEFTEQVIDYLPERKPSQNVLRLVMMAMHQGKGLRIQYQSMSETSWRVIFPVKLINSGHRQHVRAWCDARKGWRDFVLSRVKVAEWPSGIRPELPEDKDWNDWQEIKLEPSEELSAEQKKVIEQDYAMQKGKLTIKVRKALVPYVRRHLGLPSSENDVFPLVRELPTK
jgi:WYL domain